MSEIFVLFVLMCISETSHLSPLNKKKKENYLLRMLPRIMDRIDSLHIMKHGDASICSSAVFLIT